MYVCIYICIYTYVFTHIVPGGGEEAEGAGGREAGAAQGASLNEQTNWWLRFKKSEAGEQTNDKRTNLGFRLEFS